MKISIKIVPIILVISAFAQSAQAQGFNQSPEQGAGFNGLDSNGQNNGSGNDTMISNGPAGKRLRAALGVAAGANSARGTILGLPINPVGDNILAGGENDDETGGGGAGGSSGDQNNPTPKKLARKYTVPAPLKSLYTELDSEAILKLYKKLIKTKLTKFQMTAALTEPAAAAALSQMALFGNQQVALKLQLNDSIILDANAADPMGQIVQNFLACKTYHMKDKKESFNQAISECTGDEVEPSGGGSQFASLSSSKKLFDFENRSEKSGGGGGAGGAGGGKEMELSEILFGQHTGDNNSEMKDEAKKYLGDVKIKITYTDGSNGVQEDYEFIEPTEPPKKVYKERLKAVWKQIIDIENQFCQFKKNGSGSSSGDTPQFKATIFWQDKLTPEIVAKISMDGFVMIPNLLEQMFAFFQQQTPNTKLECEKLSQMADKLPKDTGGSGSSGGASGGAGGANELARDWTRLFYFFTQRVAFGQIVGFYNRLQVFVMRFPIDPQLRELLMSKVYQVLGTNNLGELHAQNLSEMAGFVQVVGKYSQQMVGGSGSMFQSGTNSNSLTSSTGPDSAVRN